MRWFSTKELRSTITAIFSVSTVPAPTPQEHAATLEAIRRKMLSMVVMNNGARSEALVRRLRYAANVESLWYARSELMHQLAREHGEALARQKVDALSEMFRELLPRGLRSRPSPLDGSYRSSLPAPEEP